MYRFLIFLIMISIFSFTSSYAEEDKEYTEKDFWEAIAKRPDAEITTIKNPKTGEDEVVGAKFKSGVRIMRQGIYNTLTGESSYGGIMSEDNSGLPAILCAREYLIATLAGYKSCKNPNSLSGVLSLEEAIRKVDEFIIKNSILPVTQKELNVSKNVILKQYALKECTTDVLEKMNNKFGIPEDSEVEKMLSVPRPPVLGYCL